MTAVNEDLDVQGNLFVMGTATFRNPIITGTDQLPFPSPAPQVQTFFARPGGDDNTGNGSLAAPFATAARAAREIPNPVPAGYRFKVNMTGVTETLPVDFEWPAWKSPDMIEEDVVTGQFFVFKGAVTFEADPQLVAAIPPADASIAPVDIVSQVAQTGSGFILLTIAAPRASWTTANLKGKFLIGATGLENAVVVEVTNTTLLVTASAALTGTLRLMEPSATFRCATIPTLTVHGGCAFRNCDSLVVNGIRFLDVGPPGAFSLEFGGTGAYVAQLCEVQSPLFAASPLVLQRINRLWAYGSRVRLTGSYALRSALWDAPALVQLSALGPQVSYWNAVAVVGGVPWEWCTTQPPGGPNLAAPTTVLQAVNLLVADIPGASGDGLRFHGARGIIQNADVRNCGRDGIRVDQGSGLLELNNVRSTIANVGAGIRITDGMQCKVNAATSGAAAGTQLRGAAGEMIVGGGAARTWADFVSGASGRPALVEYDLVAAAGAGGGFANAALAAAYVSGTGTRLYQ